MTCSHPSPSGPTRTHRKGQLESHSSFACTALDRHICASPLPYHPWHTPGAGGRDEQCPPRPRGRPAALLTSDASHAVSVSSARSPSAPSVARAAKAGAPAPGLPLSNHWYGSSPTTDRAHPPAPRALSRPWEGRGATPPLSLTLRPGARHVAVPLLRQPISRLTWACSDAQPFVVAHLSARALGTVLGLS